MIMIARRFLVLASILLGLFDTAAMAGDEGHLGGDGVLMNGQVYLFDLVEAGVELHPAIDPAGAAHPKFLEIKMVVERRLAGLADPELAEFVALKLIELGDRNEMFALAVLETIQSYQWALVRPALVDIPDGDTVLDTPDRDMVQLAARYNRAVRINEGLWYRLPPKHRAGLVYHEAIYALIRPHRVGGSRFAQSSQQARLVTGYLFSEDFLRDDGAFLDDLLAGDFPKARTAWMIDRERYALTRQFEFVHVPVQLMTENGRGHVYSKQTSRPDPSQEATYLCQKIRDWDIVNPGFDRVALRVNRNGFDVRFATYRNPENVLLSHMSWEETSDAIESRLSDDVPRDGACKDATLPLLQQFYASSLLPHLFDR